MCWINLSACQLNQSGHLSDLLFIQQELLILKHQYNFEINQSHLCKDISHLHMLHFCCNGKGKSFCLNNNFRNSWGMLVYHLVLLELLSPALHFYRLTRNCRPKYIKISLLQSKLRHNNDYLKQLRQVQAI